MLWPSASFGSGISGELDGTPVCLLAGLNRVLGCEDAMPQFRDAVGASSVCRNIYLPGLLGQTCDKQGLWVCSSALLGTGKAICSPRGSDPFNWLPHNVPRSMTRSPSYGIRARHGRCSGNAQLFRYKSGPDLHAEQPQPSLR
jgi:hypothetical protein